MMASPTTRHSHSTTAKHEDGAESPHATTHAHDRQTSPKRKSSEASGAGPHHDVHGENGKKKRRKVNHACVYCRRSHMTCDLERPCARCIKRDIGHLCHDEPRDPPKRSKSEAGVADIAPAPGEGLEAKKSEVSAYPQTNGDARRDTNGTTNGGSGRGAAGGAGAGPPAIAQPNPVSPGQLHRPAASNGASFASNANFDWNNHGVHNQFQDMHHLHPNYMFNSSEATNEYNLLNDFLSSSLLDEGGMYADDDTQALFADPLLATSSMNAIALGLPGNNPNLHNNSATSALLPPPPPHAAVAAAAGQEISRPSSTFPVDAHARDKFYMTAADPAGLSSAEDRLHKLLKAKYDAGMLRPFNHVKGYARLNAYMSSRLSRSSQLRILQQLDRFRPKFREAMRPLTDMQLVLVEMWFERKLMEYDRVFASMAIPACCWRRTGEIYRGNTEMAALLRCPLDSLRDGRLAIHEIIAEDSLVSYWEKFAAIAFDNSQKAILTSCALMLPEAREAATASVNPAAVGTTGGTGTVAATTTAPAPTSSAATHHGANGEKKADPSGNPAAPTAATSETAVRNGKKTEGLVKCCFSFTIRRDSHNIPSLIVGNFLPIQTSASHSL